MCELPSTVMSFASLDEAESALDWIGVEFADGDGCVEGTLAARDAELLDAALAEPGTPEPVRALASALRDLLTVAGGPGAGGDAADDPTGGDPAAGDAAAGDGAPGIGWRVAFSV